MSYLGNEYSDFFAKCKEDKINKIMKLLHERADDIKDPLSKDAYNLINELYHNLKVSNLLVEKLLESKTTS